MVKLGNIELNGLVYNAAGPRCITEEELIDIDNSNSCAVLSKSCTLYNRIGNEQPRYWDNDILSINSSGLPNKGYKYYNNIANKIKNKPYFVSVSGLTLEDNKIIISELCKNDKISSIELNLSCPNVIGKPQVGYDQKSIYKTLFEITPITTRYNKDLGIKLPPYFDIQHFTNIANVVELFNIQYLTCINSLGNGLVLEDKKPVIKPKNGLGGIGGKSIKPFGLSNVYYFNKLLPNIDIVGCGGIENKEDVYDYLQCGAKVVQVGTLFMKEGVSCFDRFN
tara:strand:- start:1639 stop:2478 length:840 start_codon:yes stop_codon:yes gene_type:complete